MTAPTNPAAAKAREMAKDLFGAHLDETSDVLRLASERFLRHLVPLFEERERLVAFARAMLVASDYQDLTEDTWHAAVDAGLLTRVPYDPEQHGGALYGLEPGDDWYVLDESLSPADAEEATDAQ